MPDLFEKKGATSFGPATVTEVAPSESLQSIYNDDPLSAHYQNVCHTAQDLVRYLVVCQTKRYGQVFNLPTRVLTRHAKKLLQEHTVEALARAVRYSMEVSNYPFSFVFVRERALPEVYRRCPFLEQSSQTNP